MHDYWMLQKKQRRAKVVKDVAEVVETKAVSTGEYKTALLPYAVGDLFSSRGTTLRSIWTVSCRARMAMATVGVS